MRVPVSGPTFTSPAFGDVATVNAVATIDDDGVSLFVVNRSTTEATTLTVDLRPLLGHLGREVAIDEAHLLHDDDIYAANTLESPELVGITALEATIEDTTLRIPLPAVSWGCIRLS